MIYDEILQLNEEVRNRFENLERRIRKNVVISGFYEGIRQNIVDDPDFFVAAPHIIDVNGEVITVDISEVNMQRSKYFHHVSSSIDKVKECSTWFDIDYYPFQGVKDIKKTFCCNNKFCDGCQSAISQRRYEKFAPVIDALQKTHDVAHVVFTVPNCKPKELLATLDRMYESRKYLIRYLTGKKRIRGIDFEKYGFQGGVIALEVTRNEENSTYHPHFHCVMVFNKNSGVFSRRKYINSYSFDNEKDEVRQFNKFEILLQKVWRLRFDGVEVNRHNIEELKEGYSVICERRANFHEVFKYATKGVIRWNKDVKRVLGDFTGFVHLDFSLFGRRLIQSYGILRGIPLVETVDQSAECDEAYQRIIAQLLSLENPIEQRELLSSLLEDKENREDIKFISRHNVKSIMGDDNE